MAQVQCQIEIPKINDSETLTVGHIFFLNCQGDWPVLDPQSSELRLEKSDQYKLKLLGIEYTSKTEARLKVVSYQAGDHQLKALQLVDAKSSVILSDLKLTVSSVINPQEPPAEPYGSVGPLGISLSIWYPISLILILALIFGFLGYKWKLRREKKRLLSEMRLGEQAQDPYFQFYQSLRKIQRNFSGADLPADEMTLLLSQLNEAYKIFLARHFQVPTLKWSERKILSDLKSNHKDFYLEFKNDLRTALAELSRAQKSKDPISAKDFQQLLDLLRKQVDRMQSWVKGKRS